MLTPIGGGYGIVASVPIPSNLTLTSLKQGPLSSLIVSSASPAEFAFPLSSVASRSYISPIFTLPYADHRSSTQIRLPRRYGVSTGPLSRSANLFDATHNRFGGGFELLRDGDTQDLNGIVDNGVM